MIMIAGSTHKLGCYEQGGGGVEIWGRVRRIQILLARVDNKQQRREQAVPGVTTESSASTEEALNQLPVLN